MLLTTDSPNARKIKIVDFMDKEILFVKSFDTETKEAEIYVAGCKNNGIIVVQNTGYGEDLNSGKPLVLKVTLPGCRAINRETGEEIK